NLINRSLGMLGKYFSGIIPERASDSEDHFLADFFHIREKLAVLMENLSFRKTLETIWELVGKCNRYIDEQAPWALFKQQDPRLADVMHDLFAGISIIAVLLAPFLPGSAAEIWSQLGLEGNIAGERFDRMELLVKRLPGTKTNPGGPIFPKIDVSLGKI
ncbi:MAG: class I tRNA ligase family protein, partial [bacterium]